MLTRFATLLVGYARSALLLGVAAVPWVLGLIVGLIVSLTLWIVVATMDGYRVGRGA